MINKALVKTEKTNKIEKKEKLNTEEWRVIRNVQADLKVSEEEAIELVKNSPEKFVELLSTIKKKHDIDLTRIIDSLIRAIKIKISNGQLEYARRGCTALAILYDKIYGEPPKRTATGLQVAGQNITINLKGWKFTPYRGWKTWKKTPRGVKPR